MEKIKGLGLVGRCFLMAISGRDVVCKCGKQQKLK